MLLPLSHPHLRAQQLTTQAPPQAKLAQEPQYPDAIPLQPPANPLSPVIVSDTQAYARGIYTLDGSVVITAGLKRVEADHITYDSNTEEVVATGHVIVTSGVNSERIAATHGTYNLQKETGTFYEVSGSVGIKPAAPKPAPIPGSGPQRVLYTTPNPFLFTGRMVVKSGPRDYDIYDGTITSCQLPNPDWILSSSHFIVTRDKARAHNSTFRLLKVPILYLPYVTAPADSEQRQSGFMIPTIGQSNTKGLVLGEQIYITLGRSADLVVGAEYYSKIGFAQNAAFRYKGAGLNFITLRYTGVLDRRPGTLNQGGEDILFAGRRDFTSNLRAAANIEYLSSYIFREAFTDNFNQAVDSDIVSTGYVTHESNGVELAGEADRYQGIKLVAQGNTPQQQVRIFHAPSFLASTTEHRLGTTPLELSIEGSVAGLKRTQPNFATSGVIERLDIRPEIALPLHFGGWNVVPALAARETAYTRSRVTPVANQGPQESTSALSRSDVDFSLTIRPPVLTRTFVLPPGRLQRIFGTEVRHTIEPEVTYRIRGGIDNFRNVLRFDETDVVANTDEMEYGITQRLYRKTARTKPCRTDADFNSGLNPAQADQPSYPGTANTPEAGKTTTGASNPDRAPSIPAPPEWVGSAPASQPASPGPQTICQREELISWNLTQKYFFDPTFGNAIQNGRRNIFDSTLALSGVAFLTEAREISPLISRLRVRTSASTDVEWDFDLDTGARKFTSSNVFIDLHHGNAFSALSYARLDAPGRFYTQSSDNSSVTPTGVSSLISDFNQLRFLIGYGSPAKQGLSIAANTGLDLKALYGTTSTTTTATGSTSTTTVYPALFQYAALQTSYNWNCCGLAVEYRKFELGSVRNENSYRFNFTLANLITAGNLRRAERLF